MSKIIFILNSAFSHYNASYKFAKILSEMGNEIYYLGESANQEDVIANGFQFVEYSQLEFNSFNLALHDSNSIEIEKRLQSLFLSGVWAKEILFQLNPKLLIIDVDFSEYAFIFKKITSSLILINFNISLLKSSGIPPFYYSQAFSNPNHLFPFIISEILWLIHKIKLEFCPQKKFFFFGQFLRLTNLKAALRPHITLRPNGILLNCNEIFQIVVPPMEFDYPKIRKPNELYIGSYVNELRPEIDIDRNYHTVIKSIAQTGKKIIFCSFGNIQHRKTDLVVLVFLKKLIKVFKLESNSDSILIISVGENLHKELDVQSDNIFLLTRVPQIHLLKKCSLMISHAGINSIMECIHYNVPMLVYPINSTWDQPGNSARIIFHGIGLRGHIKKDSCETINKKIQNLITNQDKFKNKIKYLNSLIHSNNDLNETIKFIYSRYLKP